jgi:hypothetical protein
MTLQTYVLGREARLETTQTATRTAHSNFLLTSECTNLSGTESKAEYLERLAGLAEELAFDSRVFLLLPEMDAGAAAVSCFEVSVAEI